MVAPRVIAERDGRTLCTSLGIANTFWKRLAGWQFRLEPPAGAGLLIEPCRSIHTFCMRFAIDVVWLDRERRIVDFSPNVPAWRIVFPRADAYAALELPAGHTAVTIGETVQVVS